MEEYKLSDIAEVQTGPFGSQLHNEDYVTSGTPIVTVEHLGNRKFSTQNLPLVSDEDAKRLVKYSLQEGDIVFSRVGSVDRCSYVTSLENGWLFSGRCLRVRCGNDCHPLFLYYYFCNEPVKQHIKSIAVGATMPSINTKLMADIPVSLPSIETQKKIASILSSLDDKIELNRRINDNLEQQAQALFDSFTQSDNGLGYCELKDIAVINPRRVLRKGDVARCIEMSNLSTSGSFPSNWEFKQYEGGMKFMNGDTIMARITPCLENGKVAHINFLHENEVAFGSTEYIVISAKEGFPPELFYFLTRNKEFVDYATKNMNGSSGRQRVSAETIEQYVLPVLTDEQKAQLSKMTVGAMAVICRNCVENISLRASRDALLPKLMSGELKINDLNC